LNYPESLVASGFAGFNPSAPEGWTGAAEGVGGGFARMLEWHVGQPPDASRIGAENTGLLSLKPAA